MNSILIDSYQNTLPHFSKRKVIASIFVCLFIIVVTATFLIRRILRQTAEAKKAQAIAQAEFDIHNEALIADLMRKSLPPAPRSSSERDSLFLYNSISPMAKSKPKPSFEDEDTQPSLEFATALSKKM